MDESQTPSGIFYREFWPHRAAVLRTARILTSNDALAEDLAQETMLKAYRSAERFRPGTDARAWLLAILRNTRIDFLRSPAGRDQAALSELPDDPAGSPEAAAEPDTGDLDALLGQIGDADLIRALQRLPDDIRWTLLLVDVEGLSLADAAGVMEIPAGTVKSRTHRGRAMLREQLLPRAEELGYLRRRAAPDKR